MFIVRAYILIMYISCNICTVMQKYVRMTILIIITFLKREIIVLFTFSLVRTIEYINKSTHGVFPSMVSSQAFHALIFPYFDPRDALQHMNSEVQLPRFNTNRMTCDTRYLSCTKVWIKIRFGSSPLSKQRFTSKIITYTIRICFLKTVFPLPTSMKQLHLGLDDVMRKSIQFIIPKQTLKIEILIDFFHTV